MKSVRQKAIIEIVEKNEIETQDELVRQLQKSGYNVTQATISRDIKELKLVKVLTPRGLYKYALSDSSRGDNLELYLKMFSDTVKSMSVAGNLVVLQTISGSANVAAEAIDKMDMPEVVGTIAGENTIFVATRDAAGAEEVIKRFRQVTR